VTAKAASSYSKDHCGLTTLIRLYAIAGDKHSADGKAQQEKIAKAMRTVRWQLTKHIGRGIGIFPSIEWYELVSEYIRAMKGLADAGDQNLPDIYQKNLNTVSANRDKRAQFVREHLKPSSEEQKTLSTAMQEDITGTAAYMSARDNGLMDDEVVQWESVKAANALIGSLVDELIEKRRDGNSHDKRNATDVGEAKHRNGHDRRRRRK
jgi:CRISPR/Cas system CSM-associated protein Csm2 small subunit